MNGRPLPDAFSLPLKGVSFHQDTVRSLSVGEKLKVLREPSNIHDRFAVAVVKEANGKKRCVGYIPKFGKHIDSKRMSKMIGGGARFMARVKAITGKEPGKTRGVIVNISRTR